MNTILTINFTGSVLLVLYFLMKHFLEERLSKRYLYRILQINLVCFMVPLMLVGEAYRGLWWDLEILVMNNRDRNYQVTPRTPMFLQIEKDIELSIGLRGKVILIAGYLFLVLLWFTMAVVRDIMEKRPIHRAIKISGRSTVPELLDLQKELKIRKKVEICLCRDASQLATIGLFHPIIFFKNPEDDVSRRRILSHELYHIKGHDVLWRWIAILVNSIHFFNPMAYILRWEIERMQELRCDEQVIANLDKDLRGKYAGLLLENSSKKTGKPFSTVAFGEKSSLERLQERIECVMLKDAKKKLSKRLVAALTVMVLGTTSLTALAYDEIGWWIKDSKRADVWITSEATNRQDAKAYAWVDNIDGELAGNYPVLYEKEYIDENGNIYPLNEGASPMALCFFHSYRDYKVVEHYRDIDIGSCEVWFYDAVMCQKCGYTKSSELTAVDRFAVCPHNL